MEKWEFDGPFYPQTEEDFKKLGMWNKMSDSTKNFIRETEKKMEKHKREYKQTLKTEVESFVL